MLFKVLPMSDPDIANIFRGKCWGNIGKMLEKNTRKMSGKCGEMSGNVSNIDLKTCLFSKVISFMIDIDKAPHSTQGFL